MESSIALRPSSISEAHTLSATLAASRIIPEALQKSPADVLAIVLSGAELGLAPMASLRALQMIKGKITISADGMHAIALASPACECVRCIETTPLVARFEAKRRGSPAIVLSFSIEDARAAGLTGNATYQKFPAAMLRARCLCAILRLVFPDVMLGVYSPDELHDVVEAPLSVESHASSAAAAVFAERARIDIEARIEGAQTIEDLEAIIPSILPLAVEQKTALRATYQRRHDELKPTKQEDA